MIEKLGVYTGNGLLADILGLAGITKLDIIVRLLWQVNMSVRQSIDNNINLNQRGVEDEEIRQAIEAGHASKDDNHHSRRTDSGGKGVSFSSLLRFASTRDITILLISGCFIASAGTTGPLTSILFGSLTATFQNVDNLTYQEVIHNIDHYCLFYNITRNMRSAYVDKMLRQNVGFFDQTGAGEIVGHLTTNITTVQEGLSDKIAFTILGISTLVAGYSIAFIKSWKLTLVLTSTVVVLVSVSTFLIGLCLKYRLGYLDASKDASGIAEDVISSIKSTLSTNSQDKLAKSYDKSLGRWETLGFRLRAAFSMVVSATAGILLLNYGLAFWVGSLFLSRDEISRNAIVTVLLSLIGAAFALAQMLPNVQGVLSSLAAASKIIRIIDRESLIDPSSPHGEQPDKIAGTIELRSISHIYDTRPGVLVLDDFSLNIPAGKRTALVGLSGSGKSTIVELIQRFYDPTKGEILLDGHNTRDLNVRWLREQMSVVSQEPLLFDTTIYENILHGLRGTNRQNISYEKLQQLVQQAAIVAQAHDFISSLPEGYQTNVGRTGSSLSGGQKQRICIARAIVGDPRILILDEATSALDTSTERIVQSALDAAALGRTTLVVAHRLSTIREADNIVVMSAGHIVEQGTHDELMALQRTYHGLVMAQSMLADKREDTRMMSIATTTVGTAARSSTTLVTDFANAAGQPHDQKEDHVPTESTENSSKDKYGLWTIIKFALSMNKAELFLISISLIFSVLAGLDYPVSSVFFGKILAAYRDPSSENEEMLHDVAFWCKMYLIVGLVELVIYSVQGVGLSYFAERLVHRVRFQAFRRILRQDMAYFDQRENSPSTLVTLLSNAPTHLASLSGTSLGSLVMIVTTVLAGFILSTAVAWRIALVCSCTVPIIMSAGMFQIAHQASVTKRLSKTYEKSANYIAEVVSTIRTVAALTREDEVREHYNEIVNSQGKDLMRSTLIMSSLYAISETASFPCMALVFWWGGTLLARQDINITQYYITYIAIVFGALSATNFVRNSRHMGNVKSAGQRLLSRQTKKNAACC